MSKLITSAFLLLFLSTTYAQLSNEILLSHKTYEPKPNIETYIGEAVVTRNDAIAGRYLRLIQFEEIPNLTALAALKKDGIELHEYLPNKAYIASFPVSYDPIKLRNHPLRHISALSRDFTLSEDLLADTYPHWAQRGPGKIEITLMYPDFLNYEDVINFCKLDGIEIIAHNKGENNFLSAIIDQDRILEYSQLPYVRYMELCSPPSTPDDTPGRSLLRTNMIDTQLPGGRNYNGEGVGVLCRDDGEVGPHIDFQGRINQETVGRSRGSHGDGVSGIMCGAGNADPRQRGMAAGATLHVIDYSAGFMDNTLDLHLQEGVLVTNSSYSDGCNAGYTTNTRVVDEQCYENKTLLHVFSAGNSNGLACDYGAGTQWGNITGGHKQGKNVIATANTSNTGIIEGSSSRGPAFDGRIKPDLSSNGVDQISTDPNNRYSPFGGTSAAAPGIAGVAAMLHQAHRIHNSGMTADGALIKAILLNTANDLGNTGPDFIYGWGSANALQAAICIENRQHNKYSLSGSENMQHTISVPDNVAEVKVMVYWADAPASVNTGKALINDINSFLEGPDGDFTSPWILNPFPEPAVLSLPAEKGIDNLNNMEQMHVSNPIPGEYILNVSGAVIPFGTAEYYVVVDYRTKDVTPIFPSGGEKLRGLESQIINWDAIPNGEPFTVSLTTDGVTWEELTTVNANRTYYRHTFRNETTDKAQIRVSRSGVDYTGEAFTISPVPSLDQIRTVCFDGVQLSWDALDNVASYEVHQLGDNYMEIIDTVFVNNASVAIENPFEEQWFAVTAIFDNGTTSQRSIAKGTTGEGLVNCKENIDIQLSQIEAPDFENLILCQDLNDQIIVTVKNNGLENIDSLIINVSINDAPPFTQQINQTIEPDSITSLILDELITSDQNGIISIRTWVETTGERNVNDNELMSLSTLYTGNGVTLPMSESFSNLSDDVPTFWRIETEDELTWTNITAIQRNGREGRMLVIPFQNMGSRRAEDGLYLTPLDLTNINETSIVMSWDMAYNYNLVDEDRLMVTISTDCGSTFTDTLYNKVGIDLSSSFGSFTLPDESKQWSKQSIDLTPYKGLDKILIKFNGINDGGHNLYIDNINIEGLEISAPEANFSVDSTACPQDEVFINEFSTGELLTYEWSLGTLVSPAAYNNSGPLDVSYLFASEQTITLIVSNPAGSDTLTKNIDIIKAPRGSWQSESIGNKLVQFTSNYSNALTYLWDFGDGNTSTNANPQHTYATEGVYDVSIVVTGLCGLVNSSGQVDVLDTAVEDLNADYGFTVYPNPTQGIFTLQLGATVNKTSVHMELLDINGNLVHTYDVNGETSSFNIDKRKIVSGVYLVRLVTTNGIYVKKLMVVE